MLRPKHYSVAMRLILRPHPNSRSAAGTVVETEVRRQQTALLLRYFVTGNDLLLPPLAEPVRANELWRHTCLEAFVQAPPSKGYFEFNFAPSTQWAVYRFSGYRTGMRIAGEIEAPELTIKLDRGHFELRALVGVGGLSDLPPSAPWKIGLSAVVEDTAGHLSYWALTHPADKADFHHPDGFSLELLGV